MRIGIDLLWVRPGICGGTESYIHNLLNGFGLYDHKNEYILFSAKDNADTFTEYLKYKNMKIEVCPVKCAKQWKRILWANLFLDKYVRSSGVDMMFVPVYSKPLSLNGKIPYITVIHDLQGWHYPEYFSKCRLAFFKFEWWYGTRTAGWVVADSDYGKEDLIQRYPWVKDKVCTIYAPIISNQSNCDFAKIKEKYGIKEEYYYCVSSLLKHKNLSTILEVIAKQKKTGKMTPLVVSGVGGNVEEFQHKISRLNISDLVINTGFISNEERDCLYENCKLFLFPSIFEGFGMPPIEAMRKGKQVVMTRKSCLQEVTDEKAVYVENPFDVDEWIEKIAYAEMLPEEIHEFEQYSLESISKKFINLFQNVYKGNA